ncbi:hypothetical protein MKX03_031727 [Papaver bracteatum]|nr:hypothetical protein MKX03_031727 [Papaver bracteatum]
MAPGISVKDLVIKTAVASIGSVIVSLGIRLLDPNPSTAEEAYKAKKDISKRYGRSVVDTNSYEDVIALNVIDPDEIDVEFQTIGGLNDVKKEIYDLVILPLKRPELFKGGKLFSPQKGVLLYGPPGTGKTMLAKAIAKESGAVFINLKISDIMSKYFGESQKYVAATFSLANKLQPAIIFIDEVDSFLGQRHELDNSAMAGIKTAFMSLWDGFTTNQNARVMVLAATNRPSDLDEAILRRFTKSFEIGKPNCCERVKILEVILKGEIVNQNINLNRIASLCEGYTGSDLLEVCKQAAYFPVRELIDNEKNGNKSNRRRALSQSDFEKALSTSKKTSVAASEYKNKQRNRSRKRNKQRDGKGN